MGNLAIINSRKDIGQNSSIKTSDSCWRHPSRESIRVQNNKIYARHDIHVETATREMHLAIPSTHYDFCGFQQGFWHCSQGDAMEAARTLWLPVEIYQDGAQFSWWHDCQYSIRWCIFGTIQCWVWSKTRVRACVNFVRNFPCSSPAKYAGKYRWPLHTSKVRWKSFQLTTTESKE